MNEDRNKEQPKGLGIWILLGLILLIVGGLAMMLWLKPKEQITKPQISHITEPQVNQTDDPLNTSPVDTTTGTEPTAPTETLPTDTSKDPADPETTQPITQPTAPPEQQLVCEGYSLFSGTFVEDGSDRPVENVAAILVTNLTGDYLTYAALQFEINGEAATFVVTGLPAGESAWVLEYNALQIDSGANFVALESAMQFIPTESWDELEVTFREGLLSAKNLTDQTYIDGYVYYKRLHTDGNYLGGITYRSSLGDLAPGDTIEVTAGHAGEELCRVVRITQNTEE